MTEPPLPNHYVSDVIDVGTKVVVLRGEHIGKVGTVVDIHFGIFDEDSVPGNPVVRIPSSLGPHLVEVILRVDAIGVLWDGTVEDLERLQPAAWRFPPGSGVLVATDQLHRLGIVIAIGQKTASVHMLGTDEHQYVPVGWLMDPSEGNHFAARKLDIHKRVVRPPEASPPPKAEPPA